MIDSLTEQSKIVPCRSDDSAEFCDSSNEGPMEQTICVDIFIAKHCFVCEYSHEIAALIRDKFPAIELQLIDIADPQAKIPDSVFATPTYLLNGRLWSLGNPSKEEVVDKLSTMLAEM